ncbi:NUDIX hydrolase [Candidatus Woesearchaeota archaeon]|jgi:8-oxo-dGTP diphosphatase|nr:NUDIX hydrolase [Candidatus Woesearchaeota archaeon]
MEKSNEINDSVPKTPNLTVDIIIRFMGGIVLIKRKYDPIGWALPGGYVDYGETVEAAAIRETKEETNLNIQLVKQFHVYSNPKRDLKKHNVTVVFIAEGKGELKAGDDATDVEVIMENNIPKMCFDHNQILKDYFNNPGYEKY